MLGVVVDLRVFLWWRHVLNMLILRSCFLCFLLDLAMPDDSDTCFALIDCMAILNSLVALGILLFYLKLALSPLQAALGAAAPY